MTPRLFVRDDAAVDIEDAAEWYEGRRAGLGGEFLRAVRAALAGIAREPLRFPTARGEVRRARVRRFPYIVFSCQNKSGWSYMRSCTPIVIRGSGRSAPDP